MFRKIKGGCNPAKEIASDKREPFELYQGLEKKAQRASRESTRLLFSSQPQRPRSTNLLQG
jgi:hypothetical protein